MIAYLFSNWAYQWLKDAHIPRMLWTTTNLLCAFGILTSCCLELAQCGEGEEDCYGAMAVYRISFGLAVSLVSFASPNKVSLTEELYHAVLAVVLIGVKNSTDFRATIQDGWFPVKFVVLVGLIIAAFFIPNSFFSVYGMQLLLKVYLLTLL